MRRICNNVYILGGWVAAFCIASICLLVFVQVLCNLLDRLSSIITGSAIGLTIPSYADFTGFLLAASSFLALAYTLRGGGHIRVSLLTARIPGRYQHIVEFFCLVVALAITGYFSWYTVLLVLESLEYNDLSSGMVAVPLWIPQLFMLVGLLVLTLALVDDLVTVITRQAVSYNEQRLKLVGDERESGSVTKLVILKGEQDNA